jgi:dolichol-phosphate mannosyltransferase
MKTLSIIVPVFNEEKTISGILNILCSINLGVKKEIIIVDDGSKDNSRKVIEKYLKEKKKSEKIKFNFISKTNGGKGSAIKKGFEIATGDIITIQDADLEYDPNDFKRLIKPIIENKVSVVYGSRYLNKQEKGYKLAYIANQFLTFLTKVIYNSKITDMETCYKVFKKEIVKNLDLQANHFDMEPEITAKILKKGLRIKEMPISYKPRTVDEGKKINWKDGVQAVYTLLYWKFKKI